MRTPSMLKVSVHQCEADGALLHAGASAECWDADPPLTALCLSRAQTAREHMLHYVRCCSTS